MIKEPLVVPVENNLAVLKDITIEIGSKSLTLYSSLSKSVEFDSGCPYILIPLLDWELEELEEELTKKRIEFDFYHGKILTDGIITTASKVTITTQGGKRTEENVTVIFGSYDAFTIKSFEALVGINMCGKYIII